jgi:LPS-assembly protein
MRIRSSCPVICCLLLTLHFAGVARASEEKQVDISAQQVEYDQNTRMAYATGDVVIVKQNVRLTADKARYNQANKDMFAEGHVRMTKGVQEWICDSLYYNFDTQALSVDLSRGTQGYWFQQSDQTKNIGTNRYEATHGYLTTCDYPEPHWRITYRRIEIFPGEKVILHDAIMRVGPVPVFYWPYLQKSLSDTGIPLSAIPGSSSRFGPFLYLSYDWGLTDGLKITPHLDLRSRHGIGFGLDFNYAFEPWGHGLLETYYVSDEDPRDQQDRLFNKAGDPVVDEKFDTNRYRLRWQHKTDLGDSWKLSAQVEKLSDPDVVEDYFQRQFRKEIQPDSFFDLTHTAEQYTAGLLARPNLNEFFTKTERLPEADLAFVRLPLGPSGFYYEGENSVANLRREYSTSFNRKGLTPGSFFSTNNYNTVRADSFHQLSYPKLYLGWLSIVPRVGGRGTYYSRTDTDDNQDTVRGVFDAGAEISFKLSNVYDCNNDALDIHGIRHVITPSLNYSYVARTHSDPPDSLFQFDTIDAFDPFSQASPRIKKFPQRPGTTRFNPVDFPSFNAIDAIDNEDVFRTGIRNQVQTKRDGRPYDLADLFVFSDLHIDPRKDEDTDLFTFLELRPMRWMALDAESRYSFDRGELIDLNTELRILQQDKWSLGIGTRYLRKDSNQAVFDFHYTLNENWSFRVLERVDVGHGHVDEQEYTLYRDLHCWAVSFSFRYLSQEVGPDDAQFWVVFSLKALPQLHAHLGQ